MEEDEAAPPQACRGAAGGLHGVASPGGSPQGGRGKEQEHTVSLRRQQKAARWKTREQRRGTLAAHGAALDEAARAPCVGNHNERWEAAAKTR